MNKIPLNSAYMVGLGLAAILSIAAYISLQILINTQSTSAAVINVSGRQRMLSQRMAVFSLRLVDSQEQAERSQVRQQLLDAIDLMEQSHRRLIEGSSELHLPGNPSPQVRSIYFDSPTQLDKQVRTYIAEVRAFVEASDSDLVADNAHLQNILVAASTQLLPALNSVVEQYQQESEAEVTKLQVLVTGIFGLILLMLIASGVVGYSSARRVRKVAWAAIGIAEGRLDEQYDLPQGHDEIGLMAAAFAHMASTMRTQLAELQQTNAETGWLREAETESRQRLEQAVGEYLAFVQQVAQGDLTMRLTMQHNGALGQLGQGLNSMVESLQANTNAAQQAQTETKRLQQIETENRQRLEQAVAEYLAFVQQVAQGDLTRRLTVLYDGALGQLGHGLNAMIESLHAITAQVQQAITAIAAATTQILAATTQQAASSTEQSAAITETATSVEQVKVIAQQTAQQASQLAQASQAALPIAQQGQQAIAQTIGGMSQVRQEVRNIAQGMHTLSGHSQAIGTIIATLSELADQITQLARNAAIESTRGGTQAADLRALTRLMHELAERAQSATGEVRTRLSAIQQATQMAVEGTTQSSQRVETGTELVGQTGGVIRQLAADVEHGAQANMQIAVAAQQQMIGMEQIGQAITAIQQATAQALAGTQQAEQAGQDLHTLAQSLQQAIAVYRL